MREPVTTSSPTAAVWSAVTDAAAAVWAEALLAKAAVSAMTLLPKARVSDNFKRGDIGMNPQVRHAAMPRGCYFLNSLMIGKLHCKKT
jgi:hypothetical protein